MKKTEFMEEIAEYLYLTSSLNIVEAEDEAEEIMEDIYG